jgi:ribonucleotide monophosphatase NagD (HAD superfamily)
VESDIGGALQAGLAAVLVRTGKYREDTVVASGIEPSATVDSIVDVPRLLLSSSPRSECVDEPDGAAGGDP